jgi:hypothetical protein
LKKYHGEPLNKTKQEYFSRKVKNKLEAMTNKEVMKIAPALTKKRKQVPIDFDLSAKIGKAGSQS